MKSNLVNASKTRCLPCISRALDGGHGFCFKALSGTGRLNNVWSEATYHLGAYILKLFNEAKTSEKFQYIFYWVVLLGRIPILNATFIIPFHNYDVFFTSWVCSVVLSMVWDFGFSRCLQNRFELQPPKEILKQSNDNNNNNHIFPSPTPQHLPPVPVPWVAPNVICRPIP